MYFWHCCRAPRNAGALTVTPLMDVVPPFGPCVFWIRMVLGLMSGKLGTPLARMQLEKASVELDDFRLVEELGPEGELEPHAAMLVAAASAAAAVSNRPGRIGRIRPSGNRLHQCGRPSGGAPHAARACLYAGACRLIVLGNRRTAPSKSVISWMPAGLDGTVVLGSGNCGTPCWRMHWAILSSFASVCAEGCVVEPGLAGNPPVMSFWHFACATLNAGAAGLFPTGMGNRAPPPGLGSGKLVTPFARMHLANASGPEPLSPGVVEPELAARSPVVVTVGLPELPPHPAARTPLTSVATASSRARGG
jgi:hypothetical protein